jgi:hypothetical protein
MANEYYGSVLVLYNFNIVVLWLADRTASRDYVFRKDSYRPRSTYVCEITKKILCKCEESPRSHR